jgi:F420-dependent oxidoreductase-like protein
MARFSFKTWPQHTTWADLRSFWVEADDVPTWSAGWLFDHFYPIFSDATGPCLEGWTTLAALAAVTRRIRVGVMVSGNTYRHPAVLANMATTLDHISNGRLELGLGAGWNEQEHNAYGITMPPVGTRMDMLEEACQVVDGLLTQQLLTFAGGHYRITEARCEPKPIQDPRPPLVIGGRGEQRTLRIAAQFAQQWNFPGGTPEQFAAKADILRQHCADVGRDPDAIELSVQVPSNGPPPAVADEAATFLAAGAQHVVINFPAPYTPQALTDVAEALDNLGALT